MTQYFFNHPIFRLVAPVVYGTMVYMLVLLLNNNVPQINDLFVTQELYVCVVLTYINFEIMRAGILVAGSLRDRVSGALGIIAQTATTLIISVGAAIGGLMLYFEYIIGFSISTTQLIMFTIIYGVTAVLYNIMYFSHHYLHKENSIRLQAEKQQRTVLEAEMIEYRNDINPDLLFESLENLIAIMYKDLEKAEDYIDCLGAAYRYVLTNRRNEVVPLSEELAAANNILRLLNERLFGQLVLESRLEEKDMSHLLIPGSLPLVIEYLARNSILPPASPFRIFVYIEDEYLTIETSLNDRLIAHSASTAAFERLQRSYSFYTETPLIKVKAYQENYIKLPVIRIGQETEVT